MTPDYAPMPGCDCVVCLWARRRAEREQRFEDDLEANYQAYLKGELVSRDDRD